MNIQWFPGHMAKTRRIITENLKMIDVVIELLDARIPLSSKNPEIDTLINNKKKVVVLNKSDLADTKATGEWIKYYDDKHIKVIPVNSSDGTGISNLKKALNDLQADELEKQKEKGIIYKPVRTMIVGIPNVGKSSLINKLAGKAKAKTGDIPGVTRQKQWVKFSKGLELLDTPGVLWPKFEDEQIGLNLALTGAIKDEVYDIEDAAAGLFDFLKRRYPDSIMNRYKVNPDDYLKGYEILEECGRKRGCLISGGEVDLNRISMIVLDEFRGGKIGRITLELP